MYRQAAIIEVYACDVVGWNGKPVRDASVFGTARVMYSIYIVSSTVDL